MYFCCENCVPKFQADPGKFKSALANSYTYQTKCPVSGKEIDPAMSSVLPTGQKVYYCCDKCGKRLMEDLAKYESKLAALGIYIDAKKILEGGKKGS